ncbi:hypothetical protein N658DRAFT_414799 [Parathielavia hyrcaniae]|uniref:Uncharacterized protein n=1 Tax=Parathielavia hyrcaniae TaxID=113614 RepID=A0AAN6T6N2_9PEZI|nr:hypothetical protein N658DRAFT_414799 [Parathielavia hyrcaniae]
MADFAYRPTAPMANERWLSSRSPLYNNPFYSARFETGSTPSLPQSVAYTQGATTSTTTTTRNAPGNYPPPGAVGQLPRAPLAVEPSFSYPAAAASNPRPGQGPYTSPAPSQSPFKSTNPSWGWDQQPSYGGNASQVLYQGGRYSPSDSMDDLGSTSLSDYSLENSMTGSGAGGPSSKGGGGSGGGGGGKPRAAAQRRPSNRDEFDGPHQFLKRPPAEYVAQQERELPRLPMHLVMQEQDSVLNSVNDRLSQCAYDFVAKYQFPIPLTQDMRPVERPQDREWTEWVYLLKRLATKRRIPARVLYNGQIKQFVTVLENSLEMRHAAKHQSRSLKDDRNILQLISAGIQVAKILKDAQAMDYLDRLYVSTEQRIQARTAAAAAATAGMRFR